MEGTTAYQCVPYHVDNHKIFEPLGYGIADYPLFIYHLGNGAKIIMVSSVFNDVVYNMEKAYQETKENISAEIN